MLYLRKTFRITIISHRNNIEDSCRIFHKSRDRILKQNIEVFPSLTTTGFIIETTENGQVQANELKLAQKRNFYYNQCCDVYSRESI